MQEHTGRIRPALSVDILAKRGCLDGRMPCERCLARSTSLMNCDHLRSKYGPARYECVPETIPEAASKYME